MQIGIPFNLCRKVVWHVLYSQKIFFVIYSISLLTVYPVTPVIPRPGGAKTQTFTRNIDCTGRCWPAMTLLPVALPLVPIWLPFLLVTMPNATKTIQASPVTKAVENPTGTVKASCFYWADDGSPAGLLILRVLHPSPFKGSFYSFLPRNSDWTQLYGMISK